jgi:hypothetical protein
MGIEAIARGRVVGGPLQVLSKDGSTCVFLLRDSAGRPNEVEYEVVCRAPNLEALARRCVRPDDALVVLGSLSLTRPAGPIEDDLSAAKVTLEATTIARELDAQREAPTP